MAPFIDFCYFRQTLIGKRTKSNATEFCVRLFSFAGAIRYIIIKIGNYSTLLYSNVLPFTGFLQLIGCLGALRLSEKLLNAYWLLLLVLLLGDAILGIFWMFKFDKIMQELQPMLK